MQQDRRRAPRKRTEMFVNKFIDGMPYLSRLVEISAGGCVLERVSEPDSTRDLYPLEFALPTSLGGTRLWIWARPVWARSGRIAMRFVGLDPVDRGTLARFTEALG